MYLHLSLLLTLTGLLFQSSFAQKNRVDSGHYIIVYCGAGPDSKAAKLQTLLPQIHEKLQIVLADVKKGVASKAFNAYFKTNDSIAHVESIFQKIAAGAAVRVPVQGAPSGFTVPYSPMIVCVDPTTPGVDDLREKCKGVTAASNPNTQHMILCDDFWTHLATKQFPQVKGCPKVKYNRFHPDDYRVMFNQFGTFVHEFAHTYTSTWVQEETYHPTAAVQLSAEESLKNPQNFALYAASEFFPFSIFAVNHPLFFSLSVFSSFLLLNRHTFNERLRNASQVSSPDAPNTSNRIVSATTRN